MMKTKLRDYFSSALARSSDGWFRIKSSALTFRSKHTCDTNAFTAASCDTTLLVGIQFNSSALAGTNNPYVLLRLMSYSIDFVE